MNTSPRTVGYLAAAVGLFSFMVFLPAVNCGFINLDDPYYVTNNPLVKSLSPGALWRILTESHLAAWLPLTYLSLAMDYHFWGDNPFGYHLTNIVLHSINTGMMVLLADRLLRANSRLGPPGERLANGWPSFQYPLALLLAGLLWGVLPLRVESVAWVAERKDVLNGLFSLATVISYLGYVRHKDVGSDNRSSLSYTLALLFFVCSLLAKQVSVTLPVVLLLLDWYPLGRFGKRLLPLVMEKIPFFVVSLGVSLITVYFVAVESALISLQDMPFSVRLFVSGNAVFEYCRLSLFPVGISPYFVLPKPLPYEYLVKTAVVAAMTLFLLCSARRRPAAAVTWFAFIVLLLPTLAFLQAGDDIAFAARYTYLPSIAFAIAAASSLALLAGRLIARGLRSLAVALSGMVAIFLAVSIGVTLRLISVWKDTGTFWSRVIEIAPVGRAYGDRGVFYLIHGKSDEAIDDFSMAISGALNSGLKSVYNLYAFRGVALGDSGRFSEAVADFDRAIELYPHPTYFLQRGIALKALGRVEEADRDFRRAGSNPPPIDWF